MSERADISSVLNSIFSGSSRLREAALRLGQIEETPLNDTLTNNLKENVIEMQTKLVAQAAAEVLTACMRLLRGVTIFESGTLGNPAYEIDCLIPNVCAAVRVQLHRYEAEAMIHWANPDGVTDKEYNDIFGPEADSDVFLDALIKSVHSWVATFPVQDVEK